MGSQLRNVNVGERNQLASARSDPKVYLRPNLMLSFIQFAGELAIHLPGCQNQTLADLPASRMKFSNSSIFATMVPFLKGREMRTEAKNG